MYEVHACYSHFMQWDIYGDIKEDIMFHDDLRLCEVHCRYFIFTGISIFTSISYNHSMTIMAQVWLSLSCRPDIQCMRCIHHTVHAASFMQATYVEARPFLHSQPSHGRPTGCCGWLNGHKSFQFFIRNKIRYNFLFHIYIHPGSWWLHIHCCLIPSVELNTTK